MSLEMHLKMKMFRRCQSCPAGQADNLPGFHLIPQMYQVFGLMTVKSLKAIGMTDNNAIPITEITAGPGYDPVKGSQDAVIRAGFDIYPRMMAVPPRKD
jgi:hypothetical protein